MGVVKVWHGTRVCESHQRSKIYCVCIFVCVCVWGGGGGGAGVCKILFSVVKAT